MADPYVIKVELDLSQTGEAAGGFTDQLKVLQKAAEETFKKVEEAAEKAAQAQKEAEDGAAKNIAVGLYKLQVTGIKFQDDLTRKTEQESARRAAAAEKEWARVSAAVQAAAAAQVKATQTWNEKTQALTEKSSKAEEARWDKAAAAAEKSATRAAEKRSQQVQAQAVEEEKAAKAAEQQWEKSAAAGASASDKAAKEQAANAQKEWEAAADAARKEMESRTVSYDQVRTAAMKLKSDQIKAAQDQAEAQAAADKKALEARVITVDQMSNAAKKLKSDQIKAAQDQTEATKDAARKEMESRVVTIEQVRTSAMKLKSDQIDAFEKEKQGWKDAALSATGFTQAMSKAGQVMIALSVGKAVVQAVVDSLAEARKFAFEMAENLAKTAAELQKIRAMRDQGVVGPADIAAHAAFRRSTTLGQQAAVAAETGFERMIGTVPEGAMTPKQRAELRVTAGRFAALGGGATDASIARARAEMVARMPRFMGRAGAPVTAAQVGDTAFLVSQILGSMEAGPGATAFTEMMNRMMSAEMPGFAPTAQSTAALVAAGHLAGQSPEAMLPLIQELHGFTRWRRMKGVRSAQAETLRNAGVTESMDPFSSMNQLFGYVRTQIRPGESFVGTMGRLGFRNSTLNHEMARYFEMYGTPEWDRIRRLSQMTPTAGALERMFEKYAVSPHGREAASAAEVDVARAEVGMRESGTRAAVERERPSMVRAGTDWTMGFRRRILEMMGMGGMSGEDIMLRRAAAARAPGFGGAMARFMSTGSTGGGAASLNEWYLSMFMEAFSGITGSFDRIIEANDENASALRENTEALLARGAFGTPLPSAAPTPTDRPPGMARRKADAEVPPM